MLLTLKLGPVQPLDTALRPPQVEALLRAAEQGENLLPAIEAFTRRHGYDHFLYACGFSMPPTAETRQWVFTTLPDAWVEHYDALDFIEIDPRVRQAVASPLPLIWHPGLFPNPSPALRRFIADAARFGVGSGVSFPLRGGRETAMVAFSSRDAKPSAARLLEQQQHLGDLMVFGAYFHEFIIKSAVERAFAEAQAADLAAQSAGDATNPFAKPAAEGAKLSPRQAEIIKLAGEGWKGKRLANKLGIEPRTVLLHWTQIRTKLRAKTREEAVVIAVRMGIIKL